MKTLNFKFIKVLLIGIILIVLALAAIRLIFPEDSWVCTDGTWQKHGNPAFDVPQDECK